MTDVMATTTAEHFYRWLDLNVHADEQHTVGRQIRALLADHPTMISEGKSWSEMRRWAAQDYPEQTASSTR